uniref:Predicted dienelactone hydrolase-like protein n=1 Tax=Adineta vaga TaxID=104782 RepID=B3G4B3_ADIVA|nr:predicted dienelactone hydrolase-like protein [Adineta vaga]
MPKQNSFMKIYNFLIVILIIHSNKCFPTNDENFLLPGDYSIGQTSYEYPIVIDPELTPTSNNLTTQIRGELFYPNKSEDINRYPILIFLPGKHPDCRIPVPEGYPSIDIGSADTKGNCPEHTSKVASHLGFSYLGRHFASYGYIVISIDILSINNKWSIVNDSALNFVRARIVLRTIEKMIEWNGNSEISKEILHGIDLSNRFDFTEIGLMGHSRGGEGVRNAYNMLMEGKGSSDAILWKNKLSNIRFKALLEITPMYYGENGRRLGVENIPWAMIVAGCEDDEIDYLHVNLAYQQRQISKQANYILQLYGANHEYFNSEWHISIPTCFGDQDPLWDVNASTFRVSDIYPPAKNTSYDVTLLKINGSEIQRQTTIFILSAFFRAYVGQNANPKLADILQPSQPLPSYLPEIGREYFNNNQSIVVFNGSQSIDRNDQVEITLLKDYAKKEFPLFVSAYKNTEKIPPQFQSSPPNKDQLEFNCLDQIENALQINFRENSSGELSFKFNSTSIETIQFIDIQLARRDSCWFNSTDSLKCSQPRIMQVHIQIQTATRLYPPMKISLKSRFNLEFVRCNAMDLPKEQISFLPVMFETIRIPLDKPEQVLQLKMNAFNGGSLILSDIRAIPISTQPTSKSSHISISILSFLFLYSLHFRIISIK